jgi:hypothetical protein
MWKETPDHSLFPAMIAQKKMKGGERKKVATFFETIGTVIGRALKDDRIVDLPFSPLFWKIVFEETVGLEDL